MGSPTEHELKNLSRETWGGLAALAIWSSSIAVARGLSESIGTQTGPALACALGGTLAVAWARARGDSPGLMLRLPPLYLWGCGALFVSCNVGLYLAIGACETREQTLVIGLVNYLWPTLTVALSVPLLRRRARWTLALGCIIAAAGTAVAMVGGMGVLDSGLDHWRTPAGLFALSMAGVAALSWGLYSNLARRWGSGERGAVPLFVLATAAALGALRLLRPEVSHWTLKGVLELCTLGVASLMGAYALWDWGIRRGDQAFLGVCSYFMPVASVAIASLYLGVRPGAHVAVGCVLVAAGAFLSRTDSHNSSHNGSGD